jgi:hypothetical protein
MADISVPQPNEVFNFRIYREFLDHFGQKLLNYFHANDGLRKYATINERLRSPEREQIYSLKDQLIQLSEKYYRHLPNSIVSICPYCNAVILQPIDYFSLIGFHPLINLPDFYHSAQTWDKPEAPRQSCKHALVSTLSVNLNNYRPTDLPQWSINRNWLYMSSSPRIMVWPLLAHHTSAVIHALPIGRLDDPNPTHRYTLYFVTYFMDDSSNLRTEEMWVSTDLGEPATGGVKYDPDLRKWIKASRLYWLDPKKPSRLVKGSTDDFPYMDVQPQGRYRIIENGEIEGPYPYKPGFIWQGNAPHHDESFPQTIE